MQIGDIVIHTTKGWYAKVREISGAEIRVKHICSKKGNPSCPSSMTAYENSRLYPKAELIVSRLPKSFQVLMEAEKKKAEHNKPRYFPDILKMSGIRWGSSVMPMDGRMVVSQVRSCHGRMGVW